MIGISIPTRARLSAALLRFRAGHDVLVRAVEAAQNYSPDHEHHARTCRWEDGLFAVSDQGGREPDGEACAPTTFAVVQHDRLVA
jgi:hypothetical protein